ncbi:MAG: permease [Geminicoccaceae bacterium]|nr:MAG: permease [Geminicoccaceae bacterium]
MTVAGVTLVWPRWRGISADPVWLGLALALLLLALLVPAQAPESLRFTAASLVSIAPFLAASILIAAYAKASRADALIAKAFQGRMGVMIVAAAITGAFSPFCSCGVIPLIAALLAMGVPLAPVMAFWLASPLMDPSMFVLTAGTLGVDFAVFKTIAAVGVGLLGGAVTFTIGRSGAFDQGIRPEIGNGGCGGATVRNPKPVVWRFWQEPGRSPVFAKDAKNNLLFLGKWLTLAFFLESLMVAYLPPELVVRAVGGEGVWPVLMATLVGVPAYLNGYAALPLVGQLLQQGMAPGAGMAFLLAGGVTSIPAAIAVWALVRPPVFLTYVGLALIGALGFGLVFGMVA